ncbi:MAG: hypothetical protein K9K64_12855, partial [Desulfohalobiaceae bacterium]|nr:hypothetical protein [Desulfohalobiaceae bacterium]
MEQLRKLSRFILPWMAIAMGAYQLLYTQVMIQDLEGHMITHLGLALLVVCLSLMSKSEKKSNWYLYALIALASIGATLYFLVSLDALMMFRSAIPTVWDLLFGGIMVLLLLAVNWIVFGKIFPVLTLVALAYLFFGRFLPPPFTVADVGTVKLVQWVT